MAKFVKSAYGLTERQEAFIKHYLLSRNATQAAIDAGYSPRTAFVQGSRLLTHVKVQQRIQQVVVKTTGNTEASVQRVVDEWRRIAFLDPAEFFDSNGNIKPIHEISEDARRAIGGLDVDATKDTVLKKLRTVSKIQGLEQLARHLGMFPKEAPVVNLGMGLTVNIHLDEVK